MSFAELEAADITGPIPTEREYHRVWVSKVAPTRDLLERAVRGGMAADRFAWVFLAGYQPAMQHTFADVAADAWSAFAVSEDRSGELPPVTYATEGETYVLNGYKTWVAGVEHVRQLVVKAGRGPQAKYFMMERDEPGLSLTTKPKGFLPEMTEGVARLENVRLTARHVATSEIKLFGPRECLYIYAAFCGMVIARCADAGIVARARSALARIAACIPAPLDDVAELKAVDDCIQSLRVDAEPHARSLPGWESDQRLVAMYSKGIQAR